MFAPFPGLRFDPAVVGDVAAATSPPYDVIDADMRASLEAASAYNMAHVLLPAEDDPAYATRAGVFRSWIADGALVRDEPSLYIYEIAYGGDGGHQRVARGVLGSLRVMPFGDRILPHEETMPKHTTDRMANLTAMQANLDVILALSASPTLADLLIPEDDPVLRFTIDGTEHRLHHVIDETRIAAITEAAAAGAVSIADGHHRYTTALTYQAEQQGPGGWDGILAVLAPATGSGFTVGPYHRLFPTWRLDPQALHGSFDVSPSVDKGPGAAGEIVLVPATGGALRLVPRPDAISSLPAPWQEASTAVAREVLYPLLGIDESSADYVSDADAAISRARAAATGGAVLVAPVTEAAIAEASEQGIRFPQKTTFFVPKPRAGLVIRTFEA